MEKIVENLKEIIVQENEKLCQKMNQKFDEIHEEMNQKFDGMHEELNQKLNGLRQENVQMIGKVLARQEALECDYGTKINAIFEYIEFHQKNNWKHFEKIDDLEKRVFALERKSV